jgi:hypothetical protein
VPFRVLWLRYMGRYFRRATVVLAVLGPLMTNCGQQSTTSPGAPSVLPTPPPPPPPSPVPVLGMACGAGLGSAHSKCTVASPTFESEMESSITQLMHDSPDIFNFKDTRGPNPKVVSVGRYYLGLVENLGQRGLCAYFNGDAIQVKKTNSFDDSFVVLASTGYVRRNQYSVTCRPASFPVSESSPPPDVAGCALGGSRSLACGADTPRYLGQITAAIQEVTKEDPALFNFNDIQNGTTDGYKVVDQAGFLKALNADLTKQGFCSIYTGDVQLKADNTLSESYHILTGSLHLRHDLESFDGTCYPAAF